MDVYCWVYVLLLCKSISFVAGDAFVTCNRDFQKVGCFVDDHSNMDLLVNDREETSPKHQAGHILDWSNFYDSIHSLACRCAEEAKKGGYYYFAIRYWAECYGGMDKTDLDAVIADKSKRSPLCKNDQFKQCNDTHSDECVGNQNSEYLYRFKYEDPFATCNRDYKKVGCFVDDHTDMELLVNDREPTSPKHQKGHILDWEKFHESIHSLACRCADEAKAGSYHFFAIRYWAECYGGRSRERLDIVIADPTKRSTGCYNYDFKPCNDSHQHECVGDQHSEYVFRIKEEVTTTVALATQPTTAIIIIPPTTTATTEAPTTTTKAPTTTIEALTTTTEAPTTTTEAPTDTTEAPTATTEEPTTAKVPETTTTKHVQSTTDNIDVSITTQVPNTTTSPVPEGKSDSYIVYVTLIVIFVLLCLLLCIRLIYRRKFLKTKGGYSPVKYEREFNEKGDQDPSKFRLMGNEEP